MSLATILGEISEQLPHCLDVKGVADEPPLAGSDYEPSSIELFEVERGAGRTDISRFGNIGRRHTRWARPDQKAKDSNPMLLRQSAEHLYGSLILHKYNTTNIVAVYKQINRGIFAGDGAISAIAQDMRRNFSHRAAVVVVCKLHA